MHGLKLFLCFLLLQPLHATELLLLSLTPPVDYQDEYNDYHPVKMVRQVLKYYPEPYAIESVSLNRAFVVTQNAGQLYAGGA